VSVTILSPLSGDTVFSPVTVSVAYSVGSTSCVLTAAVGPYPDPNPPTVSGDGTIGPSITVPGTIPTVYTVTATTRPDEGSDSQSNVTVNPSDGGGGGMLMITSIAPDTTAPAPPKNKYIVQGMAKHTSAPVAAKVTCKAYQVDVATRQWTEVDSQDDTPNNGDWKVTLSYVKQAGFRYVARAIAYDAAGNVLGRCSMHNDK
jgi:hypothetical protein